MARRVVDSSVCRRCGCWRRKVPVDRAADIAQVVRSTLRHGGGRIGWRAEALRTRKTRGPGGRQAERRAARSYVLFRWLVIIAPAFVPVWWRTRRIGQMNLNLSAVPVPVVGRVGGAHAQAAWDCPRKTAGRRPTSRIRRSPSGSSTPIPRSAPRRRGAEIAGASERGGMPDRLPCRDRLGAVRPEPVVAVTGARRSVAWSRRREGSCGSCWPASRSRRLRKVLRRLLACRRRQVFLIVDGASLHAAVKAFIADETLRQAELLPAAVLARQPDDGSGRTSNATGSAARPQSRDELKLFAQAALHRLRNCTPPAAQLLLRPAPGPPSPGDRHEASKSRNPKIFLDHGSPREWTRANVWGRARTWCRLDVFRPLSRGGCLNGFPVVFGWGRARVACH